MSDEKIRIKMCPFGHEVDKEPNLSVRGVGDNSTVLCGVCGAMGPIADTPQKAVTKWNTQQVIVISQDAYEKMQEGIDGEEEAGDEPKID